MDLLSTTEHSVVAGKKLANKSLVVKAYSLNNHQYIWPNDYINEAIDLLKEAKRDGLLPKDYHYYKLVELTHLYNRNGKDKRNRAEMDVLLTDGYLSYLFHLKNGKVSPEYLYKHWNYQEDNLKNSKMLRRLEESIANQSLRQAIESARPQFPWYRRLQTELVKYQKLAISHPNPPVKMTGTINPGQSSVAVPAIASRLNEMGYLKGIEMPNTQSYSGAMVKAVKKFQQMHGLKPDGVIGQGTIRSINVPYKHRADQIRANLERGRWIAGDFSDEYVLVNIAGFKLFYVRDHEQIWQTEVIVGKGAHKTPVFTCKMKYIDFNPTWTVPRSMLPPILKRIQSDPGYLANRGYVVKSASGHRVDPHSINWHAQTSKNFKYWLVRQPSSHNPLGRVKFMFPNPYAIYMHDTPSKQLFNKSSRDFSHGCIRMNHPFELSLMLLSHDQGFTREDQEALLASGTKKSVFLKRPVDVFIMYWTAAPEKDGFHFYHDVYHRDNELIKLLKTPFGDLVGQQGNRLALN